MLLYIRLHNSRNNIGLPQRPDNCWFLRVYLSLSVCVYVRCMVFAQSAGIFCTAVLEMTQGSHHSAVCFSFTPHSLQGSCFDNRSDGGEPVCVCVCVCVSRQELFCCCPFTFGSRFQITGEDFPSFLSFLPSLPFQMAEPHILLILFWPSRTLCSIGIKAACVQKIPAEVFLYNEHCQMSWLQGGRRFNYLIFYYTVMNSSLSFVDKTKV